MKNWKKLKLSGEIHWKKMKFKVMSGVFIAPNKSHYFHGYCATDLKGECFVCEASMIRLRAISLSCLASVNAELTPGL